MTLRKTALAACGLLASVSACTSDSAERRALREQIRTPAGDAPSNEAEVPSESSGSEVEPERVPVTPIAYDGLNGRVRNPIVSHVFTADPSAKAFEGRIYVYASHDLDDQDGYSMRDYHVFSSNDLVNWRDHGVALDVDDVAWASTLYAPDAAYGRATNRYYLYFPNGASSIGVAVSDDPGGPFVDALGGPLVDRNTPGVGDVEWVFDPMVFVDDDGQAYLYFGGGPEGTGDNARVIRLGEDMVSLADESATTIVAPDFFEAAFVNRRDGRYYFSYSTTFANHAATIDYMVGDDPVTGFEFVGTMLPNPAGNQGNNNHQSVLEYQGNWYVFYHNRVLSAREGYGSFQRSITLDRLTFDEGGNVVPLPAVSTEVSQLAYLEAHARLEAETLADQRGIEVGPVLVEGARVGVAVTDVHDGDWIGYSQVDFAEGATRLRARVASGATEGGSIDVSLDGSDAFVNLPGTRIATCRVPPTGGWQQWVEVECEVAPTDGVHDLYLRFSGNAEDRLLSIDSFQFE